MVCHRFEPERAVEIVGPIYGSGYRIGGRLVLTAAHLFPKGIESAGKVRSRKTFGTVDAKVVWTAHGADIALVELPDKVPTCECVAFGELPTGSGKIRFDLYGWPRWAHTTHSNEKPKAGGRHIDGLIYLADTSPEGFLVLEPTRVPEAPVSNEGGSDWQGISGAAVVCEDLVVAVHRQHQNPLRPASLEAEPLAKVYRDEDWRRLLERHDIAPTFSDLAFPQSRPPSSNREPRLLAADLLNKLLPSQFDEVVFRYGVPPQHLAQGVTQNQRAIAVIQYAIGCEGEKLERLLNTIYQVAPHLRPKNK